MTQQHPITPPPELVQQWVDDWTKEKHYGFAEYIALRAIQWEKEQTKEDIERKRQEAADQELVACCEWLGFHSHDPLSRSLRAARRPKQSSLKEQSIAVLDLIQGNKKPWQLEDLDVVRRALESIPDQISDSD
jgi:hypothetical protein